MVVLKYIDIWIFMHIRPILANGHYSTVCQATGAKEVVISLLRFRDGCNCA